MAPLKLAVVGDPVAHSRSPELFRAMLSQAGLAGTYEAIRVASGDGARAFVALRDEGYTGLNVTTPLKVEAFEAADTLDDVARAAGSVNVLLLGETLAGYNTDGAGALGALAGAGLGNLEDARILVLGAGPTARAATLAIRSMGARVDIWNRTQARADDIVASLDAQHYEADVRYDAILSTLLPGVEMTDVDPRVANSIACASVVVDANYGARSTLALNFNRPTVIDGFEMLHASARASFAIFTS
jgi:shikimate dehydrogenase